MTERVDWTFLDALVRNVKLLDSKMSTLVFFLVSLAVLPLVMAVPQCQSIPVSVGNVGACSNGYCSVSIVAPTTLDFNGGRAVCLDLLAGDQGTKVATVDIALVESVSHQDVDHCYYTDWVLYDTKAVCGCPWRHSADCSTGGACSRAVPKYSSNVICDSGHQIDVAFNTTPTSPGNYCWRTGFSGLKRVKVCKYKPLTTNKLTFKVVIDTESALFEYNGDRTQNYTRGSIELGSLQVDFQGNKPVEFTVVDLNKPFDFFIGNGSFINDISSYDPKKLGWYKVGEVKELSPSDLNSAIHVNYLSCAKSKFSIWYDWVTPSDVFESYPEQWASNVLPRAFLDDDEYLTAKKLKSFDESQARVFWEVREGVMAYKYSQTGTSSFIGITFDDHYIPTQYKTLSKDIMVRTNKNRKISGRWKLHCSEVWMNQNGTNVCGDVCIAEMSNYPKEYGFCLKKKCDLSEDYDCTNFTMTALNWPSVQWATYTFTNKMQYSWPMKRPSLSYPIPSVKLSMDLKLSNQRIRFSLNQVKPKVTLCTQSNDTIQIYMSSEKGSGDVVTTISSLPSKIYYVKEQIEQVYSYPINTNMSGIYTITFENSNYTVTCKVVVNYSTVRNDLGGFKNWTNLPTNFLGILAGSDTPVNPDTSRTVFWVASSLCLVASLSMLITTLFLMWFVCCGCCASEERDDQKGKSTVVE